MNTPATRYSTGAILLHWLIAALLIANLLLAFVLMEGSRTLFPIHQSIGIVVLLLTLVRIGWRVTHPVPALPATLAVWERMVARITHAGFYLLLLALPLLGWAAASSGKRGTGALFGVIPWFDLPVPRVHDLHEAFGEAHELAAYLTLALVALHIAGALKHQFLDRDGVLARMLPGR